MLIWSAASKGKAFPSFLGPEQELPKVSPAQSPHCRVAKITPVAHMVLWEVMLKTTCSGFTMVNRIPEAA